MEPRKLLDALSVAERLKDTTRHCYTRNGRHESVAEHSWMMTLMAFFMKDEFPEVDMDKVIKMCIIHDLGEAFTGDIPTFEKTTTNQETEEKLLYKWVKSLPENQADEMLGLYEEMAKKETLEAKVYKAIDSLEALIQHNISDLSTWIPKEYELNKTYADDKVAFSEYLKELREEVRKDTLEKLGSNKSNIIIRPEKPSEHEEVNKVIFEAFTEQHNIEIGRFMMEHFIEERKKETFVPELSLVAVLENGTIVGEVALHETDIITEKGRNTQLVLSQSAVLPEYRRQGIMRMLVEHALDKARGMGYGAVFLGGNPKLYARFGFEPSGTYGIYHKDREKWGDEGFMVCILKSGALDGVTGTTYYYGG